MNVKEYLSSVHNVLTATIDEVIDASPKEEELLIKCLRDMNDFVQDGKKIRPHLVFIGYCCVHGGKIDTKTLHALSRVGAACEFIHACALIHDDIIDRSDLRRGKPTLHRRITSYVPNMMERDHMGISLSILCGDLALVFADDIVGNLSTSEQFYVIWKKMRQDVLFGQLLDVVTEAKPSVSLNDAHRINLLKTTSYTLVKPTQLGAAIAQGSSGQIQSLANIGYHLGAEFQLRDDMLSAFGATEESGKKIGDDIKNGKKNIPFTLALEQGTSEQKGFLSSLQTKHISRQDVDQTLEIFHQLHIEKQMQKMIDVHFQSANELINNASFCAEGKREYLKLAVELHNRTH